MSAEVRECMTSNFVLGEVDAKVGNTEIGDEVEKYGVDGANENGQYLVDVCAEKGMFLRTPLSARDDPQVYVGKGK